MERDDGTFTDARQFYASLKTEIEYAEGTTIDEAGDVLSFRIIAETTAGSWDFVHGGYLLIEWSKPTGGGNTSTVNKDALESLINSVSDESAENYYSTYQAGDRYNGKVEDTLTGSDKSFWAEFTAKPDGPLAHAQNVLENSNDQKEIDAEVTVLAAAIAKLIPSTQLNATELYETLGRYNYGESTLGNMTEATAANYRAARKAAQDFFDTLFTNGVANDGEGQNNRAENRDHAHDLATDLETAGKALMDKTLLSEAQRFQADIAALNTAFGGLSSGDHESSTWSNFAAAQNTALTLLSEHPVGDNLTRPEYNAYRTTLRDLWRAAYGLKSASAPTVTLVFSDDFGMRHPEFALGPYYQEDLTMEAGTNTLKELLTQAKLTELENFGKSICYDPEGDKFLWDTWLVYLNGVLLRDPLEDYDVGGWSIQLMDVYGDDQISWNDVCIRNGDVVTLVRTETPMRGASAGVGFEAVPTKYCASWFGRLTLTLEKTTVKEGETVTASITRLSSDLPDYDGREIPYPYVTLAVYGPQKSDGTWPETAVLVDGSDELSLTQAGTYLVTAVDTRDQDIDNYSYPHLRGGCTPVLVTVKPLSPSELEETREAYLAELKAAYEAYDEVNYAGSDWTALTEAYTDGQTAIDEAASTAALQNALDTAKENMAAVTPIDHEGTMDRFVHYLKYLPKLDQLKYFSKADIQRMGWITSLYASMSDYQKTLVTPGQQAQYDALAEDFGEDGSGLPDFTPFTVTVQVDESGLISDKSSTLFRAIYYDRDAVQFTLQTAWNDFGRAYLESGNTPSITVSGSGNKADAIEFAACIAKEYYDHFEGIEIPDAEVDSYEVEELPEFYRYTYYILTPYQDITIHVKAVEDPVQQAKNEALTALETKLDSCSKSNYTAENWTKLTDAYTKGVEDVNAAEDKTAVTKAMDDALAAMTAIPEKSSTELGKVTVIVENATWKDEDAPFKDVIVSESIDLNGESSMMRCVLAALQKNGYSWYGTGGSGFGISYLSYIYEDTDGSGTWDDGEPKLGEFSHGQQSGWMGTLNDWFVNEGFNMFNVTNGKLKDGDVIRVQFTVKGYGTDLGATWANNDTSLLTLETDDGSLAPDFAGSMTEYVLKPTGSSVSFQTTAANKNFQVRIFLNKQNKAVNAEYYRSGEAIPVKSGDVIWIGVGEKTWPTMNDGDIVGTWYKINILIEGDTGAVEKLISAIGSVTYENYQDKQAAVDLAKGAFDALSEADQAKVSNAKTLTAAVAAIEGYRAVDELKVEITKLPKNAEDDRTAVEKAEALYKKLSDEQKDLLTVAESNKLLKALNTLTLIDELAEITDTLDFDHTDVNTQAGVMTALKDLFVKNTSAVADDVIVDLSSFSKASITAPGSYAATVTVTLGKGLAAASKTASISGKINYIKSSEVGVTGIKVNKFPATKSEQSETKWSATLPYGSDLTALTVDSFEIELKDEKADHEVKKTADDGSKWSVIVTAEDGTTTATYDVELTVSDVKVTVLDSWVYSVSDDVQPTKLDERAVSGLLEAVNPDKLGLDVGTKEAFLWLEAHQTSDDNVYTITPVFAPAGQDKRAVPAEALIGKITLTLPVPGTEYTKVLFDGGYLDAKGSASGITFEVAATGDYTLIPDAHLVTVTFHLCEGSSDDVKDGEKIVYYPEDAGKELPVAVKSGASFMGWFDAEIDGKKYISVSADLPEELYAQWSYGVKLDEWGEIDNEVKVNATVQGTTATITVEASEPCMVIVDNGDGSYERLKAIKNADGSYSFVQKNYDADMVFIIAILGDFDKDGDLDKDDLLAANKKLVNDESVDPLQVKILGVDGKKLKTVDLAKLYLALVSGKVEW